MSTNEYELNGMTGAENFRALSEGLKLRLRGGAICEIVANPGDGAYLLVKYLEDAGNPDHVGEEELCYFTEVEGVYMPAGSGQ